MKKIFLLALFSVLSVLVGAASSLAGHALSSVYQGSSQILVPLLSWVVPILAFFALLVFWYRAQSRFSDKFKATLFCPPKIAYGLGDEMKMSRSPGKNGPDAFMVVQMAITVCAFFGGLLLSLMQNLGSILGKL